MSGAWDYPLRGLRAPTEEWIAMTWAQYQRRECTYRGNRIHLSPLECEILCLLLLRRGCLISPAEVIDFIYPDPDAEPECPEKTLEALMWRVRTKLPGAIERLWGRGFVLPIQA